MSPRHKIGHFGVVSPSQSLSSVWKKLNLTQQKHAFATQKKCTTTQNKHKKTFTTAGLETNIIIYSAEIKNRIKGSLHSEPTRLRMVCYGIVNVDLYSAIITKVSNALNTLVSKVK